MIPAYNRAEVLPRAVQSVVNQTHPVDEIIIVDDCSTDNTEQVVAQMQKVCGKIRYVRLRQNGGGQVARNEGIRQASGKWIAFLDSDDEWLPERVDLCLEVARSLWSG